MAQRGKEVIALTELRRNQSEGYRARNGLRASDDLEFVGSVLKMEDDSSFRDPKDMRGLPRGFTFGRPKQALFFAVGKMYAGKREDLMLEDAAHGFVEMG